MVWMVAVHLILMSPVLVNVFSFTSSLNTANFRQTFKSDRYNISAAAAELMFVQHPPTTTATTHTWWADNEVIL